MSKYRYVESPFTAEDLHGKSVEFSLGPGDLWQVPDLPKPGITNVSGFGKFAVILCGRKFALNIQAEDRVDSFVHFWLTQDAADRIRLNPIAGSAQYRIEGPDCISS